MPDADPETVPPALYSHLSTALDTEVTDVALRLAGLNVTYEVSTADTENAYILRQPNKLRHTELFVDVETEYRVMERLAETDLPTPEPVHFCEDESILGDPFLVMTHLDGEVVPLGTPLPERFQHETARQAFAHRVLDTLARMHTLSVEPFEPICSTYSAIDQVSQAENRLDVISQVTGREFPTLRSVADWLHDHPPDDLEQPCDDPEQQPGNPEPTLVHGDFRPGNLLFAEATEPEITGILDWESAQLGDPRTELGYLLLRWGEGGDPEPPLSDLEARYPDADAIAELRAANEAGLAPFTTEPGSPTRRELVARYEDRTGVSYEHDRFYRANAALQLATVWADLHRDALQAGRESGKEPYIDYMAMVAELIVDGEFPL